MKINAIRISESGKIPLIINIPDIEIKINLGNMILPVALQMASAVPPVNKNNPPAKVTLLSKGRSVLGCAITSSMAKAKLMIPATMGK